MQQLYVLRRFSSWSFRLSAGVALLLSSVGLAASLLVSTAAEPARGPQVSWRPTPASAQAASELATTQPVAAQVLPVSLSSMVPVYSLTASAAAPRLASYAAPTPVASFEAASAPAADALKATVQRSWHTFKLAFR